MWIKMGKVVAVAAFVLTMALVEGFLQTTLKRHSAHTGLTTRSRTLRMSTSQMSGAMDMLVQIPSMPIAAEVGDVGYSSVSLYFTLALYVLTLPGLYSLVTRSAKGGKAVQKVFDVPGPANPTARSTRQTAAEVMAYFKAMNYQVAAAEEVITFKGVMGQSKSQAAFLTFCTFMGFGSLALVISILLPDVGAKAYALCLLSPYAGIYYWNNAQRVDEVKIKMETSDDEQTTSIIAEGGKEDLERFSKALMLPERGKVYIKGMFDEGMGTGAGAAMSIPSDASTDSSGVGFGSKDK